MPPPVLPSECWKPIADWEDRYQVSSLGRVWSVPRPNTRGGILTPEVERKGHLRVTLGGRTRNGIRRGVKRRVHWLVLTTFVGPCPPGLMGRHLNGDPADNRVENLCWGTAKENAQDRTDQGRDPHKRRAHCPKRHPYDDVNTYWTPAGHRACRICRRDRARERARRQAV